LVLASLLIVLSTLSLLQNYSWGSVYSAIQGLSSKAREAEFARHKAQEFALLLLVLEGLTIVVIEPLVQWRGTGSTISTKLARWGIAILAALLVTGMTFGLLVEIAKTLRIA
jgi:hypothetical protein